MTLRLIAAYLIARCAEADRFIGFIGGHHGPAFFALPRRVMPDWERRKERLETGMVG